MYRTKVYIAAEWTGDKDAVEKLHQWNDSEHWSLSFPDAHGLTQARDSSKNCSIKSSLKRRMDASKTFVLIVGEHTRSVTAGGCQFCESYKSQNYSCAGGYPIDTRSYIEYECEKAVEANIKIVVLYNSAVISKSKCPELVRDKGIHVAMKTKYGDWAIALLKKQ